MAFKDLVAKFRKGLSKTAQVLSFRNWFQRKVDQNFLNELESKLIQADVGVKSTNRILDHVREAYADKVVDENLLKFVKDELKRLLEDPRPGTLVVSAKK